MKIKTIKNHCLTLVLLMVLCLPGFATRPIIVIGSKIKKIVIACDSCTLHVYRMGAIVFKVVLNPLARIQGFSMMMDGIQPSLILEKIWPLITYAGTIRGAVTPVSLPGITEHRNDYSY